LMTGTTGKLLEASPDMTTVQLEMDMWYAGYVVDNYGLSDFHEIAERAAEVIQMELESLG